MRRRHFFPALAAGAAVSANSPAAIPTAEMPKRVFGKTGEKLTVIGVHTPETAAEKNTNNVVAQVKKLGITYPVLLDQSMANWRAWRQEVWPAIYLVDKRGRVRGRRERGPRPAPPWLHRPGAWRGR